MVCVGGGLDINRLVWAAACCVCGLVLGGGRGGVWEWHCWWWGGRWWVLRWLGVWASLWVLWVLRVRTVRACGPWPVAVLRCGWEVAAWASGWGCGP